MSCVCTWDDAEYGSDLDVHQHISGFPAPAPGYMERAGMDKDAPVDFNDPDYYRRSG